MIALGYEGGVPLKQTLIIFIPLFIAHIPRPLMHYFFFRVTFDVETIEAAWIELCNNNGEYLATSSPSSSSLAGDEGGGEWRQYSSRENKRQDVYAVDFSLESPRNSLHAGGGGGKGFGETSSFGWFGADVDHPHRPLEPGMGSAEEAWKCSLRLTPISETTMRSTSMR